MASRIRVHQIDGVTGALGLVSETAATADAAADAEDPTPAGAVQVEPSVLADLLAMIDPTVDTLVFLTAEDAAQLDGAATTRIVRLVERLRNAAEHVAAIRRVPAINAAKRVVGGVVVEAVDRETLNLLRTPEVVDRRTLEKALNDFDEAPPRATVNPTILAASGGGRVLVVEDDQVESGSDSTSSFNASN